MPKTIVLPDGSELEVPDTYSDDQIRAAVAQVQSLKRPEESGRATPREPTYEEKMQRPLSERITDPGLMWEHIKRTNPLQIFKTENLPSTGGAIGGAIGTLGGPVGSIGGAALGGATGRWAQAMLEGKGEEALPEMVKSGIWEGATSFLPRGTGQAARRIGKQLVLSDVAPATAVIKERAIAEGKPLLRKAEEIAETIIETGATTPEVANRLRQKAIVDLQKVAEQATAEGKVLNLEPRVQQYLTDLGQKVAKMKLPRQAREGIAATRGEFLAESPLTAGGAIRTDITPTQALETIQTPSAFSKATTETAGHKETLRKLESALRDAFKEVVPGGGELQKRIGSLRDVQRVLDPATLRSVRSNFYPWLFAGGGTLAGNPLTGIAAALGTKVARSQALPIGAGLAGKVAPSLMGTGRGAISPEVYADLLRAALMEGFENETPQP